MAVYFTQYRRPNGRQVPLAVELSPEVEARAKLIADRGYMFEIEVLTTGDVSATIADNVLETDVDIQIFPNQPGGVIEERISQMINRFFNRVMEEGLQAGHEAGER